MGYACLHSQLVQAIRVLMTALKTENGARVGTPWI